MPSSTSSASAVRRSDRCGRVVHALSVDVEEFASAAVLLACGRTTRPAEDVVRLTDGLLGILEEYGVRATCFVLGEVAEAYPDLVRRIAAAGHELGVHGWHHHRVFELERSAFKDSLQRARGLIADLSGQAVLGYRAVAMSITRETWWAYEVLDELGFGYSSSVFPFRGRRYGVPDAPLGPHRVRTPAGSRLVEIPLSVVSLGGVRLPSLGGGYLRHLPLVYNRLALRSIERQRRRAVVYIHPYELDDVARTRPFPIPLREGESAKLEAVTRGQWRNRRATESKLRWLLTAASFAPLREAFGSELEGAGC